MPDNLSENTCLPDIQLEISAVAVVNYALCQNNVPTVHSISITNNSVSDMENTIIRISSSPEVFLPFELNVNYIPAQKTSELKNIDLRLDAGFLAGVTEKIKGALTVSLFSGEQELAKKTIDITVLAFDEWHGYGIHPELLTSFITPNHPAVSKIISKAADFLKEWTGDPSFDAYQTRDPNRVLKQSAAIFAAIKEENIVYCVPPASFEIIGQRVRMCDAVLEQKTGTCLDLTLLYASCLEAAGLYPLLVITSGHIFAGVWLEELSFPDPVQDDPSVLTKRMADGINELTVVETTLAVSGKNAGFDDAVASAKQELSGTDPVECVIDVHRARTSGISPLPQRIPTSSGWRVEENVRTGRAEVSAPKELSVSIDINLSEGEQTVPKIMQWERKLLDLGLRNNLINLRPSKTLIPLLSSSLDELEDALAGGNDFSILPRPSEWKTAAEDFSFENAHQLGGYEELIRSEFSNKRLRSSLSDSELFVSIKNLYRTAKSSLEENGANTLYLAMGLLRWYETSKSTKPRYAPLVMLPVEIVRRAANQGYVIRLRDEEPQINITMLEKIKQDFGITITGLDPLPLDEHGIDLRMIFTVIRKSIMSQPHWDLLESAYIGIFSFSQFVMWNDIHNRFDDLMQNKIVRSLIDCKLSWNAEPMVIGERVPENNVLLPMPADASQLYAIISACEGKSFVLHGPPGTGKSQTITSLIANAVSQGRSVLFVAEKMAALEVVQKRLENIGIGMFCLELHSNKAKKRSVLEQLRRATEVTRYQTSRQYAEKAEQTAKLRSELDEYAAQLHLPRKCGYTLSQLINEYELCRSAADISGFTRGFAESLEKQDLEQHIILLERLTAAGKALGHPCGHPLSPVGLTKYSQQLRVELPEALNSYIDSLSDISGASEEFLEAVSPDNALVSYSQLQDLCRIAKELSVWAELPSSWKNTENAGLFMGESQQMSEHFYTAQQLKNELSDDWKDSFFEQNGEQLLGEYETANSKWFLPKALGLRRLAKKTAPHSKVKAVKDKLGEALAKLKDYGFHKTSGEKLFEKYGEPLGMLYNGENTDWNRIASLAAAAKDSDRVIFELSGNDALRKKLCSDRTYMELAADLSQKFDRLASAKTDLYTLMEISDEQAENNWVSEQTEAARDMLSHADELKEMIAFNLAAAEASEAGLTPAVRYYKAGADHECVVPACKKAVLSSIISLIIDGNETLNSFSGSVFNEKIKQFSRLDKELITLAQNEIFCRLASKVPDFTNEASQNSELGILQRMIKSGGRGTSIRRLFEQIPNLLPRLCPCMLMSPISAAQYLDPKREPFDLVVFDEASQLPTCKALGALARGKDAVIVGDPKQMPPTSFFASNTVDEDALETEDLESILDDCLALNMPQTHLLWHYRSRHESLISFSNAQFYENKLYTFPSVNDLASKVSFVHVDGVFERGKSRRNQKEAEAVVAEIKRRCHDPELSKQSIGVVTFNISQQNLIDDLLNEACESDEQLEKFAFNSDEPVFIKNLENVQGDERDVILFSIGFGPDSSGKVYMNFGPLNRDGGWRRLNVAVTRARCEMVVFSALTPDMMDLSRTSAEGVAALKAFLEYASGREIPVNITSGADRADAEGIAGSISAALEENGYKTRLSVGHSKYKIDVGVIDPEDPGKYILGILLDGSSYGSSKTTRDREISQTGILKDLGWNIIRIWTMDWWDNSGKEINRIITALKDIRNGVFEQQLPKEDSPVPAEAVPQRTAASRPGKKDPVSVYKGAELNGPKLNSEQFISPANEKAVIRTVKNILSAEAPIKGEWLIKKTVQSFGITRVGSKVQEYMDRLLSQAQIPLTVEEGEKIFWNSSDDIENFTLIRKSGEGTDKREAKDIPICECENAVYLTLYRQIALSNEDLLKESSKLMGYPRMNSNVAAVFALAITSAQKKGNIQPDTNGNLTLTAKGSELAAKF